MNDPCDPYVYRHKGKWWWVCLREEQAGPFSRRMDADDDAYDHEQEHVNR